jgi:hypothetical protein
LETSVSLFSDFVNAEKNGKSQEALEEIKKIALDSVVLKNFSKILSTVHGVSYEKGLLDGRIGAKAPFTENNNLKSTTVQKQTQGFYPLVEIN